MNNTKTQKYRILWKGQITGPFSRDEIEAKLKSNDVGIWAEISDGKGAWQPISEWRDRPKATPVASTHPQSPPPPSDNQQAPTVEYASSRLRFGQQPEVEDLPPLTPLRAAQVDRSDSSDETKWGDSQYEQAAKPPADEGFFYWAFMPFKKFGVFSGRARRKEYWLFKLFNLIIGFSLGFIAVGLDLDPEIAAGLVGLYCLIVIIPSWAAGVRRLHDTNRSGWWLLISMIPFIGSLVLLLFSVQDGTDGENEYGVDPKLYI